MATTKRITRTFAYKRADGYTAATLEDLFRLAVNKLPTISNRKYDMSPSGDGETFHLLSDYNPSLAYFAGVLCMYSPGRHQQVFPIEDNATTVPLSAIPPPSVTHKGKRLTQEFLEGSVYFILRGNHVVLSPSMSFRPERVEQYFNWLLRSRAMLVQDKSILYLLDQLPPDKLAKIDHVKSLIIGDSISFSSAPRHADSSMQSFDVTPEGPLWDALQALIPNIPGSISLTKALTNAVIQATLTLKIGRKGKGAEDFVNSIAAATRNQDMFDYTIDMGKQGKLKGDEFKLNHRSIFDVADGRINQSEVFRKMNDWLEELQKTKRIFTKV